MDDELRSELIKSPKRHRNQKGTHQKQGSNLDKAHKAVAAVLTCGGSHQHDWLRNRPGEHTCRTL